MHNSNGNGKKYAVWYGERHSRIHYALERGATLNVIYAEVAEFALLSSILLEKGRRFLEAYHIVKADDFYSYVNMLIYGVMEILHEKGIDIDQYTVATELNNIGKLENVTQAYLDRLLSMEYGLATEGYAQQIKDASLRRTLLVQADDSKADALNPELDFTEISERVLRRAQMAIKKSHRYNDESTLAGLLPSYADNVKTRNQNPELSPYIPTGLTHLDGLIGGFCKQKLYVFAGATKMGKSSLLRRFAYSILKAKKRVLFLSLEMSVESIINQMVSMVSALLAREEYKAKKRIPSEAIEYGKMQDYQLQYFEEIVFQLLDMETSNQFIIEEFVSPTLAMLNNRVIQADLEGGIDALIIDYLAGGKIEPSGNQRSTDISHLKEMVGWADSVAKTLNIPVITATQLNKDGDRKGSAKGGNNRPNRTDIEGSGVFAQTAQVVGLLYREHVYKPQTSNPLFGELIIDSNRTGKTGIVNLHWDGETTCFSDWRTTDSKPQIKQTREEIEL